MFRMAYKLAAVGAALAAVTAAAARAELPSVPEERIAHFFFSPELVMAHQVRLGLDTAQKEELIREMQEMQVDIVPLQARMREATEDLVEALKPRRLDESRVLALAGEVLRLELEIKQRHLRLLVRLKNLLTEEQQLKLRDVRAARARGKR